MCWWYYGIKRIYYDLEDVGRSVASYSEDVYFDRFGKLIEIEGEDGESIIIEVSWKLKFLRVEKHCEKLNLKRWSVTLSPTGCIQQRFPSNHHKFVRGFIWWKIKTRKAFCVFRNRFAIEALFNFSHDYKIDFLHIILPF